MRRHLGSLAVFGFIVGIASPLFAQQGERFRPASELRALLRYDATGISLPRPYARGKIPVVFVHGLWSSPSSWHRMIQTLEADPVINGGYQLWTFGYSTGDPIIYSSHLFRKNLNDVRAKFDPEKTDPAFDRMVLVGHSMGGLLSKMIVSESGDRIWRLVSSRPIADFRGEDADRALLRDGVIFAPHKGVRRVIYIATPHRGSHFDEGLIERAGTRLVRVPDPLRAAHARLLAQNPPTFFTEAFRAGLPTSIEELQWDSPTLVSLSGLACLPTLKIHSIIAVRPGSPANHRTDGLVPYDSAHLAGATSEKIISGGHLCQDYPDVINEVGRILTEHANAR
jgi:pimeloyl-ACP methyl ester carboxylesterase